MGHGGMGARLGPMEIVCRNWVHGWFSYHVLLLLRARPRRAIGNAYVSGREARAQAAASEWESILSAGRREVSLKSPLRALLPSRARSQFEFVALVSCGNSSDGPAGLAGQPGTAAGVIGRPGAAVRDGGDLGQVWQEL